MSILVRGAELVGRPVVTLAGEVECQVKDVVVHRKAGELIGFTLAKRGLLGGPRKDVLPWEGVHGLGNEAVMVPETAAFTPAEEMAERTQRKGADVLTDRVLTDSGTDLGEVVDVVLEVHDGDDAKAEVVGYEVQASPALSQDGRRVLIPLPDTIAVSGEHLIVPDAAREFVSYDLAGFGAAVEGFRSRLRGEG